MNKTNGYRMPINGLTPISQNKMDTGYQSMDLHQSPKTNMDIRCQSMDLYQSPKAKQNMDIRCQSMDLFQSHKEKMDTGYQ